MVRSTTLAPRPPLFDAAARLVAVWSGPVAKPAAPIKRRQLMEREDLIRQLLLVRELDLETLQLTSLKRGDLANFLGQDRLGMLLGPAQLQRLELTGLPFRMGAECHLDREGAENLQVLSRRLRAILQASMPADTTDCRLDTSKLRQKLLAGSHSPWLQEEAVPALLQLLQAENTGVRRLLVEVLARNSGHKATTALARRAIFDLDADVREAAVRALADRPRQDYRTVLLDGLRYVWPPVADHAAETLVAIGDRAAVPWLKKLASEPAPTRAVLQYSSTGPSYVVPELVRVNHHSNCLLCHARSSSQTDLVRAAVPVRSQPLPPPTSSDYYDQGSTFIHADVTYLQQDFSVIQAVARHGPWPGYQRFDYLVRNRPATRSEAAQAGDLDAAYPQRDAVLFALRELQR
jgi:hypothetical protein